MRYLLITHIPFAREGSSVLMDRLWAEDLRGLSASVGPVSIAAPLLSSAGTLKGWGPATDSLSPADGFTFIPLPVYKGRVDFSFTQRVHSALRPAVKDHDLVHSSNLFPPYTPLWFAHDLAVSLHKKTLFVVAEDFYDMLNWEWVRTAKNSLQKMRRRRTLIDLDLQVRQRVANASLTFLHTPAAVTRYRDFAVNAVHIRQPVHELEDVIGADALNARYQALPPEAPLKLICASRMEPLKGLDFVVRAIAILKLRGIRVSATLYGRGTQLEPLRRLAANLGLEDWVDFPGPVSPGQDLRNALSQAHLFLMPHLTNDFGRAFFDAMAAGLPVIAFRSAASQDTLRHQVDGLITPNADAEGLAEGITRFHQNRAALLAASQAARQRALVNTKTVWNNLRAQMIRELFLPAK